MRESGNNSTFIWWFGHCHHIFGVSNNKHLSQMNTQHNTEFFQQSIFIINDANEIEKTTLESYMREFCEGDPARAWYLKEVTSSKPVWHNDEDGEQEERYTDGSREKADLPDEFVEVTTFEVREGKFSNITRDRLVDTFETEVEANEYHLNGLYWNYCNLSFDAPFHADTREECEAEINERKAIQAEDTSA